MSGSTNLDIKGNFKEHPLAELLVETTSARLSGSFRLTRNDEKIVIYLDRGTVVFAASNLRQHRLFELLLGANKITAEQLVEIDNFVNDLELSKNLRAREILSKGEIESFFSKQINEIIGSALSWDTGNWNFSPLIRIKDSIHFRVDLHRILLEHSRALKPDDAADRFKSERESLGPKPSAPIDLNLQSHEGFVLSRFEKSFLTLSEIDAVSGLPATITRQALYSLWLGGFLFRQNWNAALSDKTIARIQTAQLRLKSEELTDLQDAEIPAAAEPPKREEEAIRVEAEEAEVEVVKSEPEPEVDQEELLRAYLERVEGASNLYELIGASPDEKPEVIKQRYFGQAKKYHPDLFYRQPDIHSRVQNAFTSLAHAYETLKTEKSRELYDFKMRKELAKIAERRAAGMSDVDEDRNKHAELAAENFEAGQELLMNGEFEESIPCFARAVHFLQTDARYHAFYGKALSSSKKHQHKAEAELQTAVRLEPKNTTYRLMLAELFVHIGLKKRAVGELNRLLAIAPNDREAIALLDSLQEK